LEKQMKQSYKRCIVFWILAMLVLPVSIRAQQNSQNIAKDPAGITKSTLAFGYRVGGGSTKIDFKGTDLMPVAGGEAKIEAKKGYSQVDAKFENLSEPTKFGAEFLTYVLWAVSTEGRTENLGEVQINKSGKGKLKVSTQMEIFSLILTAEPYFAVRIPSELVVLENQKRNDTIARIYKVASYSLMERGRYQKLVNPLALTLDLKKAPLEMYQARNAVSIARSNGAQEYAEEVFSKAEDSLKIAENALDRKGNKDYIISTARRTIQFSEDARALAVQRQDEERLANERRMAEEAERLAREQAAQEKIERAKAEAERTKALLEQEKARREAAEEASLRAAAENERRKAEEAERLAREQAEQEKLERARAEAERTKALLEQEKARRKAAEEARLRAAAEAERQRALAVELEARKAAKESERAAREAELQRQMAEEEKAQLRAKLLKQFSMVLETRDTERGLVVNMSDVLFDTGRYTLRQEAREKLARISGILLNYPELRIESEGHTDNVGSLELNQGLSQRRADAVREYLISMGIPASSISSVGKNYSVPVASNDSSEGRQKNRRVELIVSGEVIGVNIRGN
jgi:outer membrane protein OmpA-like peptidoglycan-associated protein